MLPEICPKDSLYYKKKFPLRKGRSVMEEKKKRGRPRKNVLEENKIKRPRGRPKKEVVETGVKRPRGRPRKQITETEPKEKRARGRPRKYPEKTEVLGTPRPRGRPRKTPVETEQVKRPRGRPKKDGTSPVSVIEQDTAVTKNVLEQNAENREVYTPITSTPYTADAIKTEIKAEVDEDLQKGESYLKLQHKTAGIINSNVLSPLVPAKHLSENMLDTQPTPPAITTPPLVKMNISRPKTPVRAPEKAQEKITRKASPMPNQVIVVTGATNGMGFAMTKQLALAGHIVIAVGRKPGLSRDALNEILDEYPDANVHYLIADLSLMSQVRILADEIKEKVASLGRECVDVLIHNAAEDLEEHKITYENHEYMWATNYLSVVLLTELLQPLLDRSRNAKVITFTTKRAARSTKLNWKYLRDRSGKFVNKIYEQTKLADLMFALEYDHKHADRDDIHAYSVDPGNVNTTLRTRNASGIRHWHFNFWRKKGKTVEEGIKTAVYLALSTNLPSHTVLYRDMKPIEPSKFALDHENREALARLTAIELRDSETD